MSQMHAWKAPEMTYDEKRALKDAVGESNECALMVLMMWTRTTILSWREVLEQPMPAYEGAEVVSVCIGIRYGIPWLGEACNDPTCVKDLNIIHLFGRSTP